MFYESRGLEQSIYESPGMLHFFLNLLLSAILRFVQTESMNTYASAYKKNSNTPIRIHPLLLSLRETIAASETNPDICAISENDKRVTGTDLYTSPNEFPPLEVHFSGGNGAFILSNLNDLSLISAADCQQCTPSAPQDKSGDGVYTAQGDSAVTSQDTIFLSMRGSGKKRRRASLGGVQGSPSNTHSLNAPALIRRAKGKRAQKTPSRGTIHSPTENVSDTSSREDRDWKMEIGMFTGCYSTHC